MILENVGIETVRLPARAPNLSAYAERFVRTIKEGGLDRLVLMGEGSLLERSVNSSSTIIRKEITKGLATRSSNRSSRRFRGLVKLIVESAWAACSGTTTGKPQPASRRRHCALPTSGWRSFAYGFSSTLRR
jgi:hypothetical protein